MSDVSDASARRSLSVSLDDVLKLISHSRRRRLLVRLNDRDEQRVRLPSELPAADRLDDDALEAVHEELRRTHLPMLERASVIERDDPDEVAVEVDIEVELVTPGRNFEDVAPVVEVLSDNRERLPTEWP